jgi:hypothetical protein
MKTEGDIIMTEPNILYFEILCKGGSEKRFFGLDKN